MATTSNLPRYKHGQITKQGKRKRGFWQFRHEGKYITLTKWGATQGDGSRKAFNEALKARDAFLAERQELKPSETYCLTVRDVLTPYLTKHLPTIKSRERIGAIVGEFIDGRETESNGVKAYRGFGNLPFDELGDKHLDLWEAAHPNWDRGGRRTAYQFLRAAFNYAKKKKGGRLIANNPLDGVETETCDPRTATLKQSEIKTFLEFASPQFSDLFQCCLDIGCRPMEAGTVTTDHVKRTRSGLCWVLSPDEWKNGKKTRKQRIMALPPKWQQHTEQKLQEAMRTGQSVFMFATRSGASWNANKICSSFNGIVKRIKKHGHKWNDDLVFYSTRHTAITRFLKQGKNISAIAAATGTSEEMIRRHYGHLIDDYDVLLSVVCDVA